MLGREGKDIVKIKTTIVLAIVLALVLAVVFAVVFAIVLASIGPRNRALFAYFEVIVCNNMAAIIKQLGKT